VTKLKKMDYKNYSVRHCGMLFPPPKDTILKNPQENKMLMSQRSHPGRLKEGKREEQGNGLKKKKRKHRG